MKAAKARSPYISLTKKRISPHTIRHTTAMHLLQSEIAFNVIALWLGHESPNTTHRYVEADLTMKENALARLEEPNTNMRRYRPAGDLSRLGKMLRAADIVVTARDEGRLVGISRAITDFHIAATSRTWPLMSPTNVRALANN